MKHWHLLKLLIYVFHCVASLKKEESKFKDIECDLCKEVIGKVEDMVKDKKTEVGNTYLLLCQN